MPKLLVYVKPIYAQDFRIIALEEEMETASWIQAFNTFNHTSCFQHLFLQEEKRMLKATFRQEKVRHGDHLIVL